MNMQRTASPKKNRPLRISDLKDVLDALWHEHGNLPCYIYSHDKQARVPLVEVCLTSSGDVVDISAQLGSVADEMYLDLISEISRLREREFDLLTRNAKLMHVILNAYDEIKIDGVAQNISSGLFDLIHHIMDETCPPRRHVPPTCPQNRQTAACLRMGRQMGVRHDNNP